MRQAINDNPVVQICVVGVLVLIVGFMLVTRVLKGEETGGAPPPSDAASAAAPATGAAVTSDAATAAPSTDAGVAGGAVATEAAPVTGAAPAAATTPPTAGAGAVVPAGSSGSVSAEALVPGPGMPQKVVQAWLAGDAVVLLIVRGGGTDDRLVRQSVSAVSSPTTTVFVVRAKDIARYSRITQSVGVNRVPALVIIRPTSVSKTPEATVTYGFRSAQGVVQAVEDAAYSGRDDLPYHPG